ncbi:hypothetical protein HanPI659440_Chr14g0543461 [Helianthus annuus]|nr:hypothetical protein HanPI659440_Chr14g0543461 [Helianthus annuus]
MTSLRMPEEHGATYPNDGDTAADAPAGMITLFADFLGLGNFRLPLTVFMADLLEYYRIHLSQLSLLGMVRVRHFEYCFQSQEIEPTVEKVPAILPAASPTRVLFFFSLRTGAFKILPNPPKGFTLLGFYSFSLSVPVRLKFFRILPRVLPSGNQSFFYVKEAAVACKHHFMSVFGPIPKEKITIPALGA